MPKTLNEAADEKKKTVVAEIKRCGEAITIPNEMSLDEALRVLANKQREEEQAVDLVTKFDAFIWEGAYALGKALDKKFGWFEQTATPGGFFDPDEPPQLIGINVGPDKSVQVPWGRFRVPGIPRHDGHFETSFYRNPTGMVCFVLRAQIRKKHSRLYDALCEEIKAQLKAASLYKGKVVSIKFFNENGERIEFPEPTFPVVTSMKPDALVFNRDVEAQLRANLYTPLLKTQRVRDEGIPLKRGIGLAGGFGTGKTLIGTVSANMATENGWTFLFCQSATDFSDCVDFARHYQPAVVFCEDIDRITDGKRDAAMDHILNTIDGVSSKGTEIMLVLTTNEVENIHQGMLRPGRLDVIIPVERPDAEAVPRLIRLYGGSLIDPLDDLTEVGIALAGSTPSVVREVVERAKLTQLSLSDGKLQLSAEALLISARTMHGHRKLLDRKRKHDPKPMEILGNALGMHLAAAVGVAVKAAPELKQLPVITTLEEEESFVV